MASPYIPPPSICEDAAFAYVEKALAGRPFLSPLRQPRPCPDGPYWQLQPSGCSSLPAAKRVTLRIGAIFETAIFRFGWCSHPAYYRQQESISTRQIHGRSIAAKRRGSHAPRFAKCVPCANLAPGRLWRDCRIRTIWNWTNRPIPVSAPAVRSERQCFEPGRARRHNPFVIIDHRGNWPACSMTL